MIQQPAKVITDTAGLKIQATMKAKKKPRHAKIISYLIKPRNNDPCRIGAFVTIKGKHASTVLEIASERVKWRIRRMIAQLPDEDLMKLFAQLTNNQSIDS